MHRSSNTVTSMAYKPGNYLKAKKPETRYVQCFHLQWKSDVVVDKQQPQFRAFTFGTKVQLIHWHLQNYNGRNNTLWYAISTLIFSQYTINFFCRYYAIQSSIPDPDGFIL